jgi:DNA-binding Xre family transcriptional regulator
MRGQQRKRALSASAAAHVLERKGEVVTLANGAQLARWQLTKSTCCKRRRVAVSCLNRLCCHLETEVPSETHLHPTTPFSSILHLLAAITLRA